MTDTIWAAIVGGAAGIITGSLSSLFAPLVHWGIEKRKRILTGRIEAIQRWREMIMGWRFYAEHAQPTTLHLELERGWVSLEPHLKPSVLQEVARYQGREISYNELDQLVTFLLAEVAKLEKRWKQAVDNLPR